nr:sporozoite surface protein 2 [Helicoverpa armigera]
MYNLYKAHSSIRRATNLGHRYTTQTGWGGNQNRPNQPPNPAQQPNPFHPNPYGRQDQAGRQSLDSNPSNPQRQTQRSQQNPGQRSNPQRRGY